MADTHVCSHGKTSPCDECRLANMLALRKRLDPEAPDAIVFSQQYTGNFEKSHAAKYPRQVLADLLDAGEISREQYARLRRESN